MSSSPRRRVTFNATETVFPGPDESSIYNESYRQYRSPPRKNPYVMDFIIDNLANDPDYIPTNDTLNATAASSDEIDRNSSVNPPTVNSTGHQSRLTPREPYNLRRLPSRIPASIGQTGGESRPSNNDKDEMRPVEEKLCDEKGTPSADDGLIPSDVNELDESTLLDIDDTQ